MAALKITTQRKRISNYFSTIVRLGCVGFILILGLGCASLQDAVKRGDVTEVQRLIREGENINVKNVYGHTPLHLAAYKGYVEVVKLLISSGADHTKKNTAGKLPVDSAADPEVIKLLR